MSVGRATPQMTDATTPSGVVSASSANASYPAYNAFTLDSSAYWASTAAPTVGSPQWIQYQFAAAVTIKGYALITSGSPDVEYPTDFKLQGSTNGSDWTDLHEVTSLSGMGDYERTEVYTLVSPGSYDYYRLYITARNGVAEDRVVLGELLLFQDGQQITPPMSDADVPAGYAASASSTNSFDYPWGAFSVVQPWNYWRSADVAISDGSPQWLQIQLPSAQQVDFFRFLSRGSAYNNHPEDFKLQGSNNGSDWTDLRSVTGLTGLAIGEASPMYDIISPAAYSYYRLRVSKRYLAGGSGNYTTVGELELYQTFAEQGYEGNCVLPGIMVNGTFDAPIHFEGEISLPALQASGSIALSFWGAATLPALQAAGALGWIGMAQMPALQAAGTFLRTVHFNGGVVLPALQVQGTTGFISSITLPAMQGSGTFALQRNFSGVSALPPVQVAGAFTVDRLFAAAVTLPSLRSTGTFTRSASFIGNIVLPVLRVSGEALYGHNFIGDVELPALQATGVFTVVWNLDVDIDLPALLAEGTFAVSGRFDNLVLRYTPPA